MTSKTDIPSPEMLLVEAEGAVDRDAPIDLNSYGNVIDQLRDKNYSFGKIAEWLSDRLGRRINKGAVFRSHQIWLQWQKLNESTMGIEPPHGDDDLAENEIDDFAQEIVADVRKVAMRRRVTESMMNEALRRAAAIVDQNEDDERAAEDADNLSTEA
ncbi:MAG: hypothetical protein R3F03_03080 [Opitutaceae bacterium]